MVEARRLRICRSCQLEFKFNEHQTCPQCGRKGHRVWDRMTIMAGRRFGKSKIGSIHGVDEAFSNPGSIGWACAPTNPKLHRYVIPAFQELINPSQVESWDRENLDLRLTNGSMIHFQTLEDPDQGRGQGIRWLWIDEVCELTQMHWDVIRPSLAGDTVAFFTTTPRGYDWVYEKLYKPAEDGVPGYWACHAKSADSANPDLTNEFLSRERIQMTDAMYRQEYEADFVTFTGAVYGELVLPQIIRREEDIKKFIPEWPDIDTRRQITVGIDTGADHPFGAVKVVTTDKGFVVVDEYLEREKSFFQHTQALKRLSGLNPTRFAINKNEKQPMIEFAQHGIQCTKAENDQLAGIERVKTCLHTRQLWIYAPRCEKLIKQMNALRWADPRKDGQSTGVTKVYKKDDELPDCLRYALMTWPVIQIEPLKDKQRDLAALPDTMRSTIERMRRIDKQREDEASKDQDFWM